MHMNLSYEMEHRKCKEKKSRDCSNMLPKLEKMQTEISTENIYRWVSARKT